MTGPAGTGKTSTIRVLAREMGFEILEWRNAIGEVPSTNHGSPAHLFIPAYINYFIGDSSLPSTSSEFHPEFDRNYEGVFTKFEAFLTRATTCQNIFPNIDSQPSQSKTTKSSPRRHVILLEDLPNILHVKTQTQFHEALNSLVASAPANPAVPLVIIISDAGMRGEASDERISSSSERNKIQVVDVRTVLSKDLLGGPYVTEIGYLSFIYYMNILFNNIRFNPIAPTLLRKAVQALLDTHVTSSSSRSAIVPSKEVIDIVVESANGDIRSAIMALQFACIVHKPTQKKKKNIGHTVVLEAVTRREQSLALFHLLGKVFYNKRPFCLSFYPHN